MQITLNPGKNEVKEKKELLLLTLIMIGHIVLWEVDDWEFIGT